MDGCGSSFNSFALFTDSFIILDPFSPYRDSMIIKMIFIFGCQGGRGATCWGMTGHEADPASLLRLYVDYGRHAEATNLLLEYFESFASMVNFVISKWSTVSTSVELNMKTKGFDLFLQRPADVINRKRMSAVWFPYTAIERLWCQLEELRNAGHLVDQCDKLKGMLHGALLKHLKQVFIFSRLSSEH